jgi:hypothetical protein
MQWGPFDEPRNDAPPEAPSSFAPGERPDVDEFYANPEALPADDRWQDILPSDCEPYPAEETFTLLGAVRTEFEATDGKLTLQIDSSDLAAAIAYLKNTGGKPSKVEVGDGVWEGNTLVMPIEVSYACHPLKRELMWAIHNVVAHPLSEITNTLGALFPRVRDFGNWFHDLTVPPHAPNTGRG